MKIRKKAKSGDESYWKSFTDIMAGLLLVILLVLMLLLLYMTQMNKEEHKYDHEYDYSVTDDDYDDVDDGHHADELYDRPPEAGGGGGGGGADDPGTSDSNGVDMDYGHDKAAVFVSVVDEETGKAIKKEGILFSLYNEKTAVGKTLVLNTYYPTKVAYKQFETTPEGSFYLPEKIPFGWYTLHNLKAPKGYSFAEDASFEVNKSRDWADPYKIVIPMSPSKSVIYIQSRDAETNKAIGNATYEVTAAEDIVTLDGTVRVKAGKKVCDIKCDSTGKGASTKLYFGKYTVKQTKAPQYYAVTTEPLSVDLNYLEAKDKVYDILSAKTTKVITLTDDETKEPIIGAVYSVTGRDNVKTDTKGRIILTDLEKDSTYTLKLVSLPENYRSPTKDLTFKVDKDGLIEGNEVSETKLTAYIIRLHVSAKDRIFGNEINSSTLRLYDEKNSIVEEWTATGKTEVFEDLEPGTYTLEVDGNKSNRVSIKLKDEPGTQTLEIVLWTMWDTAAVVGGAIVAVLIAAFVIGMIRSRKKKKDEEA